MSKLTELLDELCPDGVEYRVLGDLTELSIGKFVKKTKQRDDFEYPVYNGGAEPTGYFSEWNAEADSIVIAARGSIGFVNFVTTKFWAGNSSYVLKNLGESIDRRYLYHYLKHHEHDLYKLRSTGSIPAINKKPLSQMLIGIPPLEVQQEIVRVLDAFTDLEQSLVSELELRNKQFGFYRDELLNFTANGGGELCPDGVKFAPFLDVVDVLNGAAFSSKQFNTSGEGFPLIRIRDVLEGRSETYYRGEYEDRYLVNSGDILIGMDGNFHVGRWGAETALLNQRVCKVESKDDQQLLNGFLYHFSQPYFKALESSIPSGTVKHLSMAKMKTILIPVPSLEVQQEIVAKLDTFEALIQSIEQEISLRRQQYEFYRDELLSFAPKED